MCNAISGRDTIRTKKLANKKESIYLDIYNPESKVRKKEYLKMRINSDPTTATEKKENKETLLVAEKIRARRLLELQNEVHGFYDQKKNLQSNFIHYFKKLTDERFESYGNYGNWDSTYKHLTRFAGEHITFEQITPDWLEKFKTYLLTKAKTKSNKNLAQNSAHSYFNKVRAAINQAFSERIIIYNPLSSVKSIPSAQTQKEYLTLDELKKMAKEECYYPIVKNAFLFSALTGIRWSDVTTLLWKQIQFSEESGYYIRFTQQKTKGVETLPISEQALQYLGERKENETKIFVGLKYSSTMNMRLQQWAMKAGISKNITFHCARHTFATLQLTFGTDIYTVSKMLGHSELKTTQVYAQIINQKKIDAANIIPDINL